MNTYAANSTVNRQEAEALKEMIFNRVRARAEAMNNEVQNSYTSNVKQDVMDLARASFVSTKNPFSQLDPFGTFDLSAQTVELETPEEPQTLTVQKKVEVPQYSGLGFVNEEKTTSSTNFFAENRTAPDGAVQQIINQSMLDARKSMEKNTGFMGALDFLNSQASIALVYKKGKSFEATA